ncbi:MAG: DEAD/DEAH box helicase, partial [Candidatus Lokiarchaeota archaeon]|nr:DEAD/DEAH box helicase [Candidatus Lokiarchaeota archaeon]
MPSPKKLHNDMHCCPECNTLIQGYMKDGSLKFSCRCGFEGSLGEDMRGTLRGRVWKPEYPSVRIELWQHQAAAIKAWVARGRQGIVEMATATGKTVVGMKAIELCCKDRHDVGKRDARVMITCNSLVILEQWRSEIRDKMGLRFDDTNTSSTLITTIASGFTIEVQFVTMQALSMEYNAGKLAREMKYYHKHYDLIVVDEVHHLAAPEFRHAMNLPHDAAIGLSATVEGAQRRAVLKEYLGGIVFTYGIHDAIKNKIIPPFRIIEREASLTDTELDQFTAMSKRITNDLKKLALLPETQNFIQRLRRRDIDAPADVQTLSDFVELLAIAYYHGIKEIPQAWKDVQVLLFNRRLILENSENKNQAAIRLAIELGRNHKCLLFHMTIGTCNWLLQKLTNAGIDAWVVHSELTDQDRADHLAAFKKAEHGVLIAPRVLDEGVDIPDADVGINAANNTSKLQLVQRMGRVLRKYKEKRPLFYQLFCTIDAATQSVIAEVKNALAREIHVFREHVVDFEPVSKVDHIEIPTEWAESRDVKPTGPALTLHLHQRKTVMAKQSQDDLSFPPRSMKKPGHFVGLEQLPEKCGICGKSLFLDTYELDGKKEGWIWCHTCACYLRKRNDSVDREK